jgi:exodeoxyribonuclease V alpha subunit
VQDAIPRALDTLDVDLFARAGDTDRASTVHRLLGARPDSVYYRPRSRASARVRRARRDEASMADLALAAKLFEAMPRGARVILLGDKDQLASVETGSVLGDLCKATAVSSAFAKRLAAVTGVKVTKSSRGAGKGDVATPWRTSPLADSIALLERSYRFGPESGIGKLARLVNAGDGAGARRC